MKAINFLSRVVLICNICFVFFVVFNRLGARQAGQPDTIQSIPFLKELIIVLGFPAIIFNLLICITYIVLMAIGKWRFVPRWLGVANGIFLFAQIYYFFVS